MITFHPFEWKSNPPLDVPFDISKCIKGIKFLGNCSNYNVADTWYPTWSSDDVLYSPFTDGITMGIESNSAGSELFEGDIVKRKATTGNAMLKGTDPLNLEIIALGVNQADPYPYGGRYPCGSLVYNGVWYYGTYCLSPYGSSQFGDTTYNWPWMGPFIGFRISTNLGKT